MFSRHCWKVPRCYTALQDHHQKSWSLHLLLVISTCIFYFVSSHLTGCSESFNLLSLRVSAAELLPQTMTECQGLLVCTGCYVPGIAPEKEGSEKSYKGHRDFPFNNELYKPASIFDDVSEAIQYILDREQISLQ